MRPTSTEVLAAALAAIEARLTRPKHLRKDRHLGAITRVESDPLKREWRQLKRRVGARQALKLRKAARRQEKLERGL